MKMMNNISSNAGTIRKLYMDKRLSDPYYRFSPNDIHNINKAYECLDIPLSKSQINNFLPTNMFENKGVSDDITIRLWNEIMPNRFSISSIDEIKPTSDIIIDDYDRKYPLGRGMSEREFIVYVNAQSSSAFLGIQNPSKSQFALNSMNNTLMAHSNPKVKSKDWLIRNLSFVRDHIINNPSVMDRSYADACLSARTSSASIKGIKSYRDLVLETSWEDIIRLASEDKLPVEHMIFAGTRSDRRGKYRLICSFNGYFRIIDYMLNNGSYALCEGEGILSKFTTEGFNNKQMWPELFKMSNRDNNLCMVCQDFKGYDTQISLNEYLSISKLINEYRLNHDNNYRQLFDWYEKWMCQPKPLVTRSNMGVEVIVENYRTLASGLHGTHSFENLIGISTKIEAEKRGVVFKGFWTNGDDQNALIERDSLSRYLNFIKDYFEISESKSLIGHEATVWGKLWFTRNYEPTWEIGTIRSLWEREGGQVSFVEDSKLQSNYCKILQVLVVMIRLNKPLTLVKRWAFILCKECKIDHERIPIRLNNLSVTSNTKPNLKHPVGLIESKQDLMRRNFPFIALNVSNYYDMLYSMYRNNTYFDMNVTEIQYHDKGTILYIERGFDYSDLTLKNIPWMFRGVFRSKLYTLEQEFVRDVLQGTKSYDGSNRTTYMFYDMVSLAKALHDRNKEVWKHMMCK